MDAPLARRYSDLSSSTACARRRSEAAAAAAAVDEDDDDDDDDDDDADGDDDDADDDARANSRTARDRASISLLLPFSSPFRACPRGSTPEFAGPLSQSGKPAQLHDRQGKQARGSLSSSAPLRRRCGRPRRVFCIIWVGGLWIISLNTQCFAHSCVPCCFAQLRLSSRWA